MAQTSKKIKNKNMFAQTMELNKNRKYKKGKGVKPKVTCGAFGSCKYAKLV